MMKERILAVIPARGGSKGIPGKNIKLLAGKPLIYYTIEAARRVFNDDQILISTDDEEIMKCVESTGLKVPFLRPPELATDSAGMYEVLTHAVSWIESTGFFPEILILLQPTTPFRTANHIVEAMSLFDLNIEMVVSVKETSSNPYYVLYEENSHGWLERSKKGYFVTRQECPMVWEYNGGIYIINTKSLKEKPLNEFSRVRKYVMDEWSSHDIDTRLDWELAEILAAKISLT
jgi:CMP-N,N'-diacetyllegionaminic acid synthase